PRLMQSAHQAVSLRNYSRDRRAAIRWIQARSDPTDRAGRFGPQPRTFRPMRSRSASSPIFAVATIAVALLACKNKDDPAPDPGTAPTAANTATVPTTPKIEMPLFDHHLSNVCNGMPEKRTKKYAKQPGEIHSLIVFSRTSESD